MFAFTKFSLARRFMLLSLMILVTGMLVIGAWVGQQIRVGVINRTAAITSLYMDSLLTHHLTDLSSSESLEQEHLEELEQLLTEAPFAQQIVSFKLWSPDGRVLYSPNSELIGQQFLNDDLQHALDGEVLSTISALQEPENSYERENWDRLIETYAPIWGEGGKEVIAVAEFYQTPEALEAEIRAAQLRSWLVVGSATLVMYLLLTGMVGQASNTILRQQADLRENVKQLRTLLTQNEQLSHRVRRAAARTTALNEQFLHRISADLHDGPAQNMALALLRIEGLTETYRSISGVSTNDVDVSEDFDTVQTALDSALADLRVIAAGLRLPDIGQLSLIKTVQRVVHEYEQLTKRSVVLDANDLPADAPLPVKITLYRLLQEALSNGYKHANGAGQTVRIGAVADELQVEVTDKGQGFDPEKVPSQGSLGLVGMRERVEVLGGRFAIVSQPEDGTSVRASLPLDIPED
jgi:signal transduction histidine kinase